MVIIGVNVKLHLLELCGNTTHNISIAHHYLFIQSIIFSNRISSTIQLEEKLERKIRDGLKVFEGIMPKKVFTNQGELLFSLTDFIS